MPTTTVTITSEILAEQECHDIMFAKANPWANRGKAMKIALRTMSDGSVKLVMPIGTPPDSVGYNLNRAFQRERKAKMVAKLRAKMATRA